MKNIYWLSLLCISLGSCEKDTKNTDEPEAIVVSASGDINPKLNEFRSLLGDVINTTPGQTAGRREINWDGVPDIYTTQNLPSDFFNPVAAGSTPALQRGLIYSPEVSARISTNAFADLEPSNSNEFSSFSGSKTFSAVSSNLWNVDFEVAGQRVAASVKGFGAVFSDVDDPGSTTIEYFSGSRSLGVFKVPVRTSGTHSFLGVYFPHEKVTRVRFKQGSTVIANGIKDISSGGTQDLVVMDDFLYDEPRIIQ